jgi:hypothetical protein
MCVLVLAGRGALDCRQQLFLRAAWPAPFAVSWELFGSL